MQAAMEKRRVRRLQSCRSSSCVVEAVLILLLLFAPCSVSAKLDRLLSLGEHCFDTSPCTMLLDREKAVGCGQCTAATVSEPMLELTQLQDLFDYINNRFIGNIKRVLLLPESLFFNTQFLTQLPYATNVAAVVVHPDETSTSGADMTPFSELSSDDPIPNRRFSVPTANFVYNNRNQSDNQTSLFFPFNIFFVSSSDASSIRSLARRQSQISIGAVTTPTVSSSSVLSPLFSPRYLLESSGQMYACPTDARDQQRLSLSKHTPAASLPGGYATLNSSVCLKDGSCRPVGGHSVWSSLGSLQVPALKQVIAVTAPMDTLAFFHDLAQGAATEVASLATLMAVVEAVGTYWRSDSGRRRQMIRQPTYFAWAAQAWGYAGSSRFLEDLANFQCKTEANVKNGEMGCVDPYMFSIKFKDLAGASFTVLNLAELVTPLTQVQASSGNVSIPKSSSFYVHGLHNSENNQLRQVLTKSFNDSTVAQGRNAVPPDASQSFAIYLPNASSVSISNYATEFTNQYYHSQLDVSNLIPSYLRDPLVVAATGIARSVISLAFDDPDPAVTVNRTTIDGFIDCLTSNWTNVQCDLSLEYQGSEVYQQAMSQVSPSNYAGVFFPYLTTSELTPSLYFKSSLITFFLAYHNRLADGDACSTSADCGNFASKLNANVTTQSDLRLVFCSRGLCVAADTFPHDAFGTAIDAANSDRSVFEVNQNHSNAATSPERPQWTESYWGQIGLCGKTVDSGALGGLVLGIGFGVNIFSLIVAGLLQYFYFAQSKSSIEPAAGQDGVVV